MLFKITGVDAQGRKRELNMDAATEAEARQRAGAMGVRVDAAVAQVPTGSPARSSGSPAVGVYQVVLRLAGAVTLVGGVAGAVAVGAGRDGNPGLALAVLVSSIVAAVGQLAFAELLALFVRLVAASEYAADRLRSLDQVAQRVRRA